MKDEEKWELIKTAGVIAGLIVVVCIFFDWGNYNGHTREDVETMTDLLSVLPVDMSVVKQMLFADRIHSIIGIVSIYPVLSLLTGKAYPKLAAMVACVLFGLCILLNLFVLYSPSFAPFLSTIGCGVIAYCMYKEAHKPPYIYNYPVR